LRHQPGFRDKKKTPPQRMEVGWPGDMLARGLRPGMAAGNADATDPYGIPPRPCQLVGITGPSSGWLARLLPRVARLGAAAVAGGRDRQRLPLRVGGVLCPLRQPPFSDSVPQSRCRTGIPALCTARGQQFVRLGSDSFGHGAFRAFWTESQARSGSKSIRPIRPIRPYSFGTGV
jgi:hypothetical protein